MEGMQMTSKRELRNLNKEDLLKIISDLTDENEELNQLLKEKEAIIDENIVKYWSWDKIKLEFNKIENIELALAFLDKILAEKAICSNKNCPVFPSLDEADLKTITLERFFQSVYDITTAKKTFRTRTGALDQGKYKKWETLYWNIRFMLKKAFQEIKRIGIPNENERRDITEAHERENITIKNLGEARMMWQGHFAENVDDGLKRDRDLQRKKEKMTPLTPDHPEYQKKYGVFAKEQAAALEREQAQKKNKKRS